jgi:hypothetical protein
MKEENQSWGGKSFFLYNLVEKSMTTLLGTGLDHNKIDNGLIIPTTSLTRPAKPAWTNTIREKKQN